MGASVMGLDPGFKSFGWSVLDMSGTGIRVDALGVWRTEKSKRKVLATHDNHRRARELAVSLSDAIEKHRPLVICAESLSFVRSSSVMAQIGSVWGIVAMASTRYGVPVVMASPQDIKRATTGKANASKEEVQAEVLRRFPEAAPMLAAIRSKLLHEHPVDSIGAVLACLHEPAVMMARQAA